MKAAETERPLVPEIRNIQYIGEEPEPIMFLHFTGDQWRAATRDVRILRDLNRLPVRCPSAGALRFTRLGGERGDVIVSPEEAFCLGSPGETPEDPERVCIQIPISRGGVITFECFCFPRAGRPPTEGQGPTLPRPSPVCRIGFDREKPWRLRCISDDCEECVGPILSMEHGFGGLTNCLCSE